MPDYDLSYVYVFAFFVVGAALVFALMLVFPRPRGLEADAWKKKALNWH